VYIFAHSFCILLSGQALDVNLVKGSFQQIGFQELIDSLNKSENYHIFLSSSSQYFAAKDFHFDNIPLEVALQEILEGTDLDYLLYQDYAIIIGLRTELRKELDPNYFRALEESLQIESSDDKELWVVGSLDSIQRSGETILRGKLIDRESRENLVGATVLVIGTGEGTVSDKNGDFALELDPGTHTLSLQYIGYQTKKIPVKMISSGVETFEMDKSMILLDEVVVEAQARDENIQSVQVGASRITVKEIRKLPSFLGEVDLIKSLLLQPGVSTIGEGSSGFNVRGGNSDHNLIMIDEGFIFNSSHALGLFSSFNTDIVSDAVLYKGMFPSKYGGRVASVLNVNMRDGNSDKLKFKLGLGIVSSRLTMEGPIQKNKTTFLFSGRSTYSDWLLKSINVPELKQSSAFFYDMNIRFTHRFNEKNNVTLSFYSTRDKFTYTREFGFNYGTNMGQMNYRKVIGDKTLSTFSAIWSKYKSEQMDLTDSRASTLTISNEYYKLKENISFLGDVISADFGISTILYRIRPGEIEPNGLISIVADEELEREKGLESALYTNVEWQLTPRFSFSAGLRFTWYQYLGSREMFLYSDPAQPEIEAILGKANFGKSAIYNDQILEPRFTSRLRLDPTTSLKFGYARTSQFINQISTNDTPTPTNIWQLTNQYIPHFTSHNLSLGIFKNFHQNIWITSLELFYRKLDQIFDYKDFADLVVNDHVETELLTGIGRSKGVELSIHRQIGPVSGWVNYTYSRSERKIKEINNNTWYPSHFDKPHDLSVVSNIHINKRSQISVSFSYSTGRPTTIPVDRHSTGQGLVVLNYSGRNQLRIPDYHRLDVAYTLAQGFRKSKKFKTSWIFSVYNVYGRRNAFSVYVDKGFLSRPAIKRLSVLGSVFPSITFDLELL